MRQASFGDAASAERLVGPGRQIGNAISEHLIAELGDASSRGESAAADISAEPSGHGWDESA